MAGNNHKARAKSLQKLTGLQLQLLNLAQAELAQTHRQRDLLNEQIAKLMEAMNGMSTPHRLFPHLYARQLDNLRGREQVLIGQSALQEQKILTERTKSDRMAQRLGEARKQVARQVEEEELMDLIELRFAKRV